MSYREPEHAYVVRRSPDGFSVEIDREIAPIIEALWKRGITTTDSCQGPSGERGHGYIQFATATDAQRFLSALGLEESDDPNSLYQRVGEYRGDLFPSPWLVWRFDAHPYPRIDTDRPTDFEFTITVDFPPSDIPEIRRRLGAAEVNPDA
jgi:hypothetical protein